MTIDKSQGPPVNPPSENKSFSHGKLYVAFGRVSFKEDVLTLVTDQARSTSKPDKFYTTKIVHKSLLENNGSDKFL